MSSRSRSNSLSSKGECKNCVSNKEKWRGHLCLRHSSCLNHESYMWYPDCCDNCVRLFQDSSSKDHSVSSKARFILKEIMRSAEAAAGRKNLSGFVSTDVFAFRFRDWMGTFNNAKSVRADSTDPALSMSSRRSDSTRSRDQAASPRTPRPTSSRPSSAIDLVSAAIAEAQIEHEDQAAPPKGHRSRSPKASTSKTPSSSSREKSRSPSHGSRKRPHHIASSPREPSPKYTRHSPRRERSSPPHSSLQREFEEFRRFKQQKDKERRSHCTSPSPSRRQEEKLERARRSRSRSRSQRRQYTPSPSRREKRLGSRSSSSSSRDSSLHNKTPSKSPGSYKFFSEEDLSGGESTPRSLSPANPSAKTQQLFGSDSEDEPPSGRLPDPDHSSSPLGWTPPIRLESNGPVSSDKATQPDPVPAPLASQSQGDEEMRPDLTYYFLSQDAKLNEDGLSAKNLPNVPRRCLHLAKRNNRQIVAFLDPAEYPALEFISRFTRVGSEKDQSPSQRDLLRSLNRIVQAGDKHNFGFNWHVEDHDSQDSDFTVNPVEVLEQYADVVSQAKGFGDEAKRPPLHPHVPLRAEGPKLQKLVSFLEAGCLSPTSHHLRKGYRDGRATREPSKMDRDVDHEYRRAARSALGIKLAWLFLENITDLTTISAQSKLQTFKAVIDVFKKDVDGNMDYQITRAVHHRRNMIQLATQDMPQADVRAAIQDLPLPAGPTLVHESAAVTIEETLQKPEGRQLAIIRHRPFQKSYKSFKTSHSRFHRSSPSRPSTSSTAPVPTPVSSMVPQRKPTRPVHPATFVPKPKFIHSKTKGNKFGKGEGNNGKYGWKQSKTPSKPFKNATTKKDSAPTKQ